MNNHLLSPAWEKVDSPLKSTKPDKDVKTKIIQNAEWDSSFAVG